MLGLREVEQNLSILAREVTCRQGDPQMDREFVVTRVTEILDRTGRIGLTDRELQMLLGQSRITLGKRRAEGVLPFCRQGGKLLYTPSQVVTYLQNCDRSDRAARRSR